MSKPVTRGELDQLQCSNPDCTHEDHSELTLRSRCHPKTPTWVTYERATGTIRVECALCHRLVMRFPVAEETETVQ